MNMLRSVLAVVVGYVVMVAGAWLGQETFYPSSEYGSPLPEVIMVGILTSALGGLGGTVTALLAPSRPFLHLIPMAALIAIETVTLYVNNRVSGPLWFELLAGASLIAGTFIGAWLGVQVKHRSKGGLGRFVDYGDRRQRPK